MIKVRETAAFKAGYTDGLKKKWVDRCSSQESRRNYSKGYLTGLAQSGDEADVMYFVKTHINLRT